MATIRVNKTSNYTVMSNYHLKEKNMSLKAKGLLSVMLSLPDDWDYSIAGLVAICKENETAVKTALKELQEFGYLRVTKLMPNKSKCRARIEYVYDVFEKPEQEHEKQDIENLYLEDLYVENQGQLNTKELSTKKLSTNNSSKKERETAQKNNFDTKEVENKVHTPRTFDEIIDSYTDNEQLRSELKEHLRTRKKKKASLTNRAIELSLKELDKLADTDEEKILIVQNSIMGGYSKFYKLKKDEASRLSESSFDVDEFEKYLADKYKQ